MMFYIMYFIADNDGLNNMSGGPQLRTLLTMGTFIIGMFSVIFLFYTNSFLIKRRKKEFGLFNILGMEKKHISKVMLWESFFTAVISLVAGLLSGIIISKLMFLLLLNIVQFDVTLNYLVSMQSLIGTTILFIAIFVLTLLNNLRHIHLAKPIELLKGGQVGEKEPKTKWILVIVGIITLSIGYYIALVTESPLAAMSKFFTAVLLVIIGTYALFIAGTIALLKLLRKNKKFYYQTKHFIGVSGMIYRMKQNAVGLSNICILSTAVLVMLSTTVSLYIGMEDLLKNRFPKEIAVTVDNVSAEQTNTIESIIKDEAKKHDITIKDALFYRYLSFPVVQKGSSFIADRSSLNTPADLTMITLIPLNDYNQMEKRSVTLNEGEVLLFNFRGEQIEDKITLNETSLKVKEQIEDMTIDGKSSALIVDSIFLIVKDEMAMELFPAEELNKTNTKNLSFYYGFDAEGESNQEIALTKSLQKTLKDEGFEAFSEGAEESRESFFSLYGGLFFLGIFLGALFIMATVLIIFYKQISEGYDDKERFEIMQKVGLSKIEIKKAIKSQVLLVFFLPLVTAVVHIAFAFKVITKLLALLNLTNISLFAICTAGTILIFAVFYGIIYALTAREYYKIVS